MEDPYHGKGFVQGSETSKAAHDSVDVVGVAKRIRDHLVLCGEAGATDHEMEQALGLSHQTVSAASTRLRQLGKAKASGMTRTVASGCQANAWIACDEPPPPKKTKRKAGQVDCPRCGGCGFIDEPKSDHTGNLKLF
jgi:hypothetical protein